MKVTDEEIKTIREAHADLDNLSMGDADGRFYDWAMRLLAEVEELCTANAELGLALMDAKGEIHGLQMRRGLDTVELVCFYEQEFYPLSNFSSFSLEWDGEVFPTSEHAYHYEKFRGDPFMQELVVKARSAHDAYKLGTDNRRRQRADWDDVKVVTMRTILCAKVDQHDYVRRKLLQTGERQLIENSWRDSFWGWGPNRDGYNQLGKLWMEIRAELRATDDKYEEDRAHGGGG